MKKRNNKILNGSLMIEIEVIGISVDKRNNFAETLLSRHC